jgi:Na+-driven multidrug efflux pump
MFQGLGNTLPSIASSGMRMLIYAGPLVWLSKQPFFRIEYVWHWSIVATGVQALVSMFLLRTELRTRLGPMESRAAEPVLQVNL